MTQSALPTPFSVSGALDLVSLERMARHHLEGGATVLVALGPEAETPSLSADEQREILRVLRRTADEFGAALHATVTALTTAHAARLAEAHGIFADRILLRTPARIAPQALAAAAAATCVPVDEARPAPPLTLAELASRKLLLTSRGLIDSARIRLAATPPASPRRATTAASTTVPA